MKQTLSPAHLVIRNLNTERTEGFFTIHYIATGNVYNDGGMNADNVRLVLKVLNSDGGIIYQTTFSPEPSTIAPGQSAD
jgi:hypothetical protein